MNEWVDSSLIPSYCTNVITHIMKLRVTSTLDRVVRCLIAIFVTVTHFLCCPHWLSLFVNEVVIIQSIKFRSTSFSLKQESITLPKAAYVMKSYIWAPGGSCWDSAQKSLLSEEWFTSLLYEWEISRKVGTDDSLAVCIEKGRSLSHGKYQTQGREPFVHCWWEC